MLTLKTAMSQQLTNIVRKEVVDRTYNNTGVYVPDLGVSALLSRKVRHSLNYLGWQDSYAESGSWAINTYGEGNFESPHMDCADRAPDRDGRQRVATAMLILQRAYEGGELVFGTMGYTLTPPPGTLLVWSNVKDGVCSMESLHEITTITKGELITLTRYYNGI